MKRFEQLGVLAGKSPEERSFRYLFEGIQLTLSDRDKYGDSDLDPCSARSSDITCYKRVLLLEHLEIPRPFDNPRDLVLYGANLAVDYFFGSWRNGYSLFGETLTVSKCRMQLTWADELRDGLLLALVVNEIEIARKIASYLDAKVRLEEPEEDCYYLMLLAHLISGESSTKYSRLMSKIDKGRRKRSKLLLCAALAWEERNAPAFRKALVEYLNHFAGKEFNPNIFIYCASADGSILWNLARISGLQFEPLPEELMDFIVTDQAFDHTDSQ